MRQDASFTADIRGLSEAEARARLQAEGYNELPRHDRRTHLRIVLDVIREPMLALLIGGGLIYLALGDIQEALILIAFALASVSITIVQEWRTERVLEALRDLTSPRAMVIRDGKRRRIAGRDVVRGDMIVLAEGDRVPADGVLQVSRDLAADESLLTGESVPVGKHAAASPVTADAGRPGSTDVPMVFSGTLIVRGTGLAQVTATGKSSEIGRIGQSLSILETEQPRLREQTRRLVRVFALAGAAVSAVAIILYGLLRGGWLEAFLAGIALGMSMLPEEFPVVLMVFMAMGAWRISGARVLTRRASAIETLGSATVLCTDKTGTLTENRMSIAEFCLRDGTCVTAADALERRTAPVMDMLQAGIDASAPDPFDPMERAFHDLGRRAGPDAHLAHRVLARTYGLRPELLAVTQVWQDEGSWLIATKGAPEAIARLCRLSDEHRLALIASVEAMAARGLRVLGVARARLDGGALPEDPLAIPFAFLGLVGLADPLRPAVRDAVGECHAAGIKVVMITGDYPATAAAIAAQAGLRAGRIMLGEELERLDDAALAREIAAVTVFARISPTQKLRIVNAFKARGEIVAMTGDGVNDAPSLKAAHIGIAMGGRGTDVAREASSIVLLDDDFGSIVEAIRLGRRIYDNLRKAMAFILAVHVPIAGLALLPLLLGLPIIFSPVHIAFLEMVIDPVCTLAFEAEPGEKNLMRRPPRAPRQLLFSAGSMSWSAAQGLSALALVAIVYALACRQGQPEGEIRALTFLTLVIVIVALIAVNRSFSSSFAAALRPSNAALNLVMLVVALMLALALLWPPARNLFRFAPLHAHDLALALAAGIAVLAILEFWKPFWRRRLDTPVPAAAP